MKLLPYSYLVYLNYLLAAATIAFPWVLSQNTNANIGLSFLGLILFFVSACSKGVSFPKVEIIEQKIVVLVSFLFAVFLSFLPYLVGFTEQTNLMWLSFTVAGLELLAIFLTDLEGKK